MICRTGVQDRLKIRLGVLVELPFKKFRFAVTPWCVPHLKGPAESVLHSG